MDLFDMVDQLAEAVVVVPREAPDDELPALGPPPTDDELEAQFLGIERAGCPSWSRSAGTVKLAFERLLASAEEGRREFLVRVERDSYQAARRRKVAMMAVDAEHVFEG